LLGIAGRRNWEFGQGHAGVAPLPFPPEGHWMMHFLGPSFRLVPIHEGTIATAPAWLREDSGVCVFLFF
jgi:hypothetical protein